MPKPYRLNNMNKAAFRTTVLTATLGVLVLALFACVNEPPSQVEPCGSGQENVPSCEPRDATGLSIFHPTVGGAAFDYELPTLEDVLNEGLHGLGASPTHIAFRGTFQILGALDHANAIVGGAFTLASIQPVGNPGGGAA